MTPFQQSQLELFRASVLKQAKWREIAAAVGPTAGLEALDLGSDNGVISWLLRERGGRWTSADLSDDTVAAIGEMVGERVVRLRSAELPFPNHAFDLVVVVDLLEHVEDDRLLLREIARCLRPGGRVVINTPHRKPRALLPHLRHRIGLSDAWHGHRREGYRASELARLLPPELALTGARTYSRTFSHLLDTALNWVFLQKTGGQAVSTEKGMVVTGGSHRGTSAVRSLRRVYPAMRGWAALDRLLPWSPGYMLLASAVKRPASSVS